MARFKPRFCPKCGSLLKPFRISGSRILWVCNRCGYTCSGDRMKRSGQGSDYVRRMTSLYRILEEEKNLVFREALKNILRCEVIDDHGAILTLQLENDGFSTTLGPGDYVGVVTGDEKITGLGVVIDSYGTEITVLKHEDGRNLFFDAGSVISLVPLEPIIAYDLQLRMIRLVLSLCSGGEEEDGALLVQNPEAISLFINTGDSSRANAASPKIRCSNTEYGVVLDESQRRVVDAALNMEDNKLLLVVGPPGTGKTRVISCIARKLAEREEKVLITSHTNRAVDNAVLLLPVEYTLRVGRPEKLLDEVKPYLLCSYYREPHGRMLEMIDKELSTLLRTKRSLLREYREYKKSRGREKKLERIRRDLQNVSSRITMLLEGRRSLIESIILEEVSKAKIIGSTLVKSQLPPLTASNLFFDTVIIDEASQASAALALLAMVRGRKWIVVGDHNQLPPIFRVVREDTVKYSAFTWLMRMYENRVLWLTTHYRSNHEIIEIASKHVYDGRIKPHPSCYEKKLKLRKQPENPVLDPEKPVVFVHVREDPLCIMRDNGSIGNTAEAEIAVEIVRMLISHGVSPERIGVITPYRLQASIIARKLLDHGIRGVEVSTVDSFQGREKDVILISLTTTSPSRIDFVSEPHRLNVAVTRAIRKLILIGDYKNIIGCTRTLLLRKVLEHCLGNKRVYDWEHEKWVEPEHHTNVTVAP